MSADLSSICRNLLELWQNWNVNLPSLIAVPPIIGVLGAELGMFTGHTDYALWGHLFTLLFCLLVPIRYESTVTLLTPFALLPIFRLVNLGMPTFFELTLFTLPFIYLPLLPTILIVVRAQDNFSIGKNPRAFVIGVIPAAILSALLAVGEYTILEPEALIPEWSIGWLLVITVVMFGTVALVEELLFRGVLQRMIGAHFGRWTGVVIASVLFGAMHSIYGSGFEVVFACLIGFVNGIVYEWSDSISLVIVMNTVLNVFLFAVFPLQGARMGIA